MSNAGSSHCEALPEHHGLCQVLTSKFSFKMLKLKTCVEMPSKVNAVQNLMYFK